MRVILTSAGLETKELQDYFLEILGCLDMTAVRALFIPTAAINADAIAVLPKCMNDLLKCGIPDKNIKVNDLHKGMRIDELRQFDMVYLCGGDTRYLIQRMNETGFHKTLMEYIKADGVVLGVSAGSLIFANNFTQNLGLIDTKLHVHCAKGDKAGKVAYPLKDNMYLTNTSALVIRNFPDGIEVIGNSI